MTSYWVMRTNRSEDQFLSKELAQGRLRQGWGWLAEQDLDAIRRARVDNLTLSDAQRQCWRGNRRMLHTEPDGIRTGDIVLVPHLPKEGMWSVTRVAGPYRFEIDGRLKDYGHILPVASLSGDSPVHPYEESVSARLRETMRTRLRLWNIDGLAENVQRLLASVGKGQRRVIPIADRLPLVLEAVEAVAGDQLSEKYRGEEFEVPCVLLLKAIYGDGQVEATGGRCERGADAICRFRDPLGVEHGVAVQIKMWTWDTDWTRPLEQIRQAHESYEGITAGVILSTSKQTTSRFDAARLSLEVDLGIPIRVILQKELMRLFIEHLPGLA